MAARKSKGKTVHRTFDSAPRHAIAAGDRVFLRRPSLKDRAEFHAMVAASRKLHGRWLGLTPQNDDEFAAYIRRGRQANREHFLICRVEDRAILGVINLMDIIRSVTQNCHVGYYVHQSFAGSGYMTDGLKLVMRLAFSEMKLHRMEAAIQSDNARSIALVERCGFRYEGTAKRLIKIKGRWRDHERWAMLAEEWRNHRD